MTQAAPTLQPDALRRRELLQVVEELPDTLWADASVSQAVWDRALLDPARDILSRGGKGFRGRMVEHGWSLAGGAPGGVPDVLPITIELLHAGSLVVDDIQDNSQERRGKQAIHRRYGTPVGLNMANWLYFLSTGLVGRAPLDAEVRLHLLQDISESLLRCHQGQALDLSVEITAVPASDVTDLVASSTTLKTGSLMSLAGTMGARATRAESTRVDDVSSFALELGVALQMLDDWSSLSVARRWNKGAEDLALLRPTWPWAWATEVDGAFEELAGALGVGEEAPALDSVRDRFVELVRAQADEKIDRQFARVEERLKTIDVGEVVRAEVSEDIDALRGAFS